MSVGLVSRCSVTGVLAVYIDLHTLQWCINQRINLSSLRPGRVLRGDQTAALSLLDVNNSVTALVYDPNAKRFKRTLVYFNTDTQYDANFRGNPLYQATKRQVNNT